MIYDLIIIGAGAAGLFAGASLPAHVNGLILEKGSVPGRKLLMSGGGQCNLTHGGSIKDFISHYGQNGKRIRSILYQFNNQAAMEYFEKRGLPLFEREDGKVFPKSLQARDVLDTLVKASTDNGFKLLYSSPVTAISVDKMSPDKTSDSASDKTCSSYTLHCNNEHYQTKKLIVATGGYSYPTTGSDGDIFPILEKMGIHINPAKPALVPIYVQDYPYKDLAGISFSNVKISINDNTNNDNKKVAENSDAFLLTHESFSGPSVLNISRYATTGNDIIINYCPVTSVETMIKELILLIQGNPKQILTVLYEYFNKDPLKSPAEMPKRFLEVICMRAGVEPAHKASQITGATLKAIVKLLTADRHSISRLGGYNVAMVTSGGVSLDEVNIKTLESKKFSQMYFIGEALDVDGDTGGYNLQFAFSSGNLVAQYIGSEDLSTL
jgi:predicted Rossmann fold flavoprotein